MQLQSTIASTSAFIFNPVTDHCREQQHIAELRRKFARDSYVRLPGFLRGEAFDFVKSEVGRLESRARDKCFEMDGYKTPRVMKALGGQEILRSSPLAYIYLHYAIREIIEQIVGTKVYTCQHPNEYMVVNYLLSPGATHGWHLDDPAYALIIFIEAPPPEAGGHLEYIKDWRQICRARGMEPEGEVNDLVAELRKQNLIKSVVHKAGDAYLMRANQCLHRVSEIVAPGVRRVIINMAFEETSEPVYGLTASLLYS